MRNVLITARPLALCFALVASAGCASFKPYPEKGESFLERAETKQEGNVQVTAGVPSAQETRALFGVSLYRREIQPIWLEITNNDEEPVWMFPVGIDPDYFSPLEAAYIHHVGSPVVNSRMNRHFRDRGMGIQVPPGERRSGYVFTTLDEGTKEFNVDLVGEDQEVRTLTFFIRVPGLRADHQDVDFEGMFPPDEIVTLDDESVIDALRSLPPNASDKKGTGTADPLNLVVIGDPDDVYMAFIRAGWDETETIYGGSALKTGLSFVFGGKYRYSPVSALYVHGRGQDVAFQKARNTIHERNHLRLWMTPMRYEGKAVWAGQISRDIGVRFTMKTITTHKIDPDVDEAREYLVENLWYAQVLAKLAFVQGVGAASIDEPRRNLTGDPYFTDGFRAVLWLSSEPVDLESVEFVDWENPPER